MKMLRRGRTEHARAAHLRQLHEHRADAACRRVDRLLRDGCMPMPDPYRHVIPWLLLAVLVARDLYIACFLPALRKRGLDALPVHFLGTAATIKSV